SGIGKFLSGDLIIDNHFILDSYTSLALLRGETELATIIKELND
ncbi:6254_t:CDS:2, partial [Scutellospora calospora]